MEINNGHSGRAQDKTIINRIMQRFRPIAPRPVTEGSEMVSVPAELISNQKTKRKYVRVKKNSKSKIIKAESKGDLVIDGTVDGFMSPSGVSGSKDKGSFTVWSFTPTEQPPIYLFPTKSVNDDTVKVSVRNQSDLAAGTPSRKVIESWLIVDGMTETYLEIGELGSTDTEKKGNLEVDTCPGLISDSEQKVQWMNLAYKKLVDINAEEEGKAPVEVVVELVLGQKIPETCQVFTCNVRVIYTWRKEKHTQTMPCDVWRMDFGGFAWRLDATAALRLGR